MIDNLIAIALGLFVIFSGGLIMLCIGLVIDMITKGKV